MSDTAPLSGEFLAAIIEHVAHPVFVKDREHRFVLVNRALCEMVGYPRSKMLGKTDHDFFPAEEADFFRQKDLEMFSTEATVRIDEEPITTAAGEKRVLATTKVPYRNEAGEVTHVVGIISDITDIKRARDTLLNAKQELERRVAERTAELVAAQHDLMRADRLAVLGQLAGGLAHQLRNPLGAIQNAVTLIRGPGLSETQQHALAIIVEEIRRADRTISDLLDYARVRPAEKRPVPVLQLIEDTLDLEQVPDGVRVSLQGDLGAAVSIDAGQVQSALANVVRNGLEAMEEGGELHVAVSDRGGVVQIAISDSGSGVPAEMRERLFEPLVTTKPQGSGLGLSTARNLVENQGGRIYAAERPGWGATFVIELPGCVM